MKKLILISMIVCLFSIGWLFINEQNNITIEIKEELKETCSCPFIDCGDYWVNACGIKCPEGQTAICDCGSCSEIVGISSCRCL